MCARCRLALSALVALSLILAGCWGDDSPPVETARVTTTQVSETVSAPARVDAAASEAVAAEVAGSVADLGIEDGEAVRAGEVVVRLDSPQLDSALEEADEALTALEATPDVEAAADLSVSAPPAPGNPAREAVAELDASVEPRLSEARQRVEDARRRVEEATAALPEEVVEQLPEDAAPDAPVAEAAAALDALEATYEGVRGALLSAGDAAVAQQRELSAQLQTSLAEAQGAISTAVTDVNQRVTQAQRAQLDATRQEVEARRERLVVEAPIDGFVEIGRAEPGLDALGSLGGQLEGLGGAEGLEGLGGGATGGESPEGGGLGGEDLGAAGEGGAGGERLQEGAEVVPGQTLFRVLDLSEWYVEADIDEVDAPAVVEGQRATVLIDAFPDQEFEGIVESVALTAERGLTGGVAFPTRIRLIDPPEDPAPRVGMTASVEIATETVEADLAVPTRAVVRRDEGTAVYAVRDGVAELVPVEVLAQGDDFAAVDADLEPGEPVVVAGYEALEDGTRVRVE